MAGTAFSAANWSGYDEATVTNPASALTDFSLLIDISTLSSDWKAAVQSDGADIRCTFGDDTTELPFDLIDWSYGGGSPTGLIRVKTSLANSGTQKVRVWAGYSGTATAYGATETYGSDNAYDSNWVGYWPGGGGTDRTSNGNDGSASGGVTIGGGTGQVGSSTVYDGTDDKDVLDPSLLPTGTSARTTMGWHKTSATSSEEPALSYGGTNGGNAGGAWDHNINSGVLQLRVYSGTSAWGSGLADGSWHHTAITLPSSGTTGDTTGYIDGSSSGAGSGTRAVNTDTTAAEFAHDINTASGFGYGSIELDDWQVHSVARSSDWIAEEYAQSNSQSTFWGTWAWTATGGGGYTLDAGAGSFALTGNDQNLQYGRVLAPGAGAFALTGNTAPLQWNRILSPAAGTFNLSGPDQNLQWGHILATEAGAFLLAGQDAGLLRGYLLTSDTGVFDLSGLDQNLQWDRILSPNAGGFALTGQGAGLLHGYLLTPEAGPFALTGNAAPLRWDRVLALEVGAFLLTGYDAALDYSGRVIILPPLSRTFVVQRENRIMDIGAEVRIINVQPENRIVDA